MKSVKSYFVLCIIDYNYGIVKRLNPNVKGSPPSHFWNIMREVNREMCSNRLGNKSYMYISVHKESQFMFQKSNPHTAIASMTEYISPLSFAHEIVYVERGCPNTM